MVFHTIVAHPDKSPKLSLLLWPFPYLGSAHRVFNLHMLWSGASSIFFMYCIMHVHAYNYVNVQTYCLFLNLHQPDCILCIHSLHGRHVGFCSVQFCSVLLCSVLFSSVLFCSVLFCSVLFCSVLFCSVLFCSVLFCSVLFCSDLFCCSVLFCSVLFCSVLFCSVLLCSVLLCSVLFCSVLFCSVLFCSVLFCSVLFCSVLFCSVLFCSVLQCSVLFCSVVTSLHLSFGIPILWCPSTSIFHVLHLHQSFSPHGLTISIYLLLFSHLGLPHLTLFIFLHSCSFQSSLFPPPISTF